MKDNTLKKLSAIVRKRIIEKPEGSYVSKLLKKGKVKLLTNWEKRLLKRFQPFLPKKKSNNRRVG